MYRKLNDLRILRLALHLEETFERYEESLRSMVPEVQVRARLAPLFEDGPGHVRLRRAYAGLSMDLASLPKELRTEDLLQTLHDCEEAAHSFYLFYLDQLADPKLVALFRDLAAEERGHAEAVEASMAILRGLPRSATSEAAP